MAKQKPLTITARSRLLIAGFLGLAAAASLVIAGAAKYAPLAGWDTAAVVYVGSVFLTILKFDSTQTKSHAVSENPGRAAGDLLVLIGSIASLVAVGFLIMQVSSSTGIEKAVDISLGLLSVVISWAIVHTSFLLRYARLYYGNPEGGIDFNESSPPRYADFAYLAFTIGMTFQVSDTDLKTKEIRATALRHALLSYLFGTVIIATTINTLASLSN
jgi:uncharacterized membrane protein